MDYLTYFERLDYLFDINGSKVGDLLN